MSSSIGWGEVSSKIEVESSTEANWYSEQDMTFDITHFEVTRSITL
jgi:hypothetical protein